MHKLDRPLPVSTVVTSKPAEQQESPPLPPLPYIAIKGDNRSPLHNVSNVSSRSMVFNIPRPLPSSPPSVAGQGRRTINDGVAVASCVATKTTTSDVCVIPSVREGSGVPECLPVGTMLPQTPSSETSIDASDVSGENNVRAVTVSNISGVNGLSKASGASNASAVSRVLGVSNRPAPAATTNTNPPTPAVRVPHQNHHHPLSPNSTITQQHSAKTDNSLQIMSKAGRVTSSGKDPAMGLSAASNRSLVQEQRSRLVTGSRSCGRGGVSADCEVTAVACESRRGSNSASKTGAAHTSPGDSATHTVAEACDDRAEKTPFPAPATSHVGLDLVPVNDPCQKVITAQTVNASQLSANGTSPSLFPDSPNWASPGARPTGTGRSASPGGLQTAQSTSESPISVDGRSPGVCAASSSVMTPPTLGKGTHPTQPSTASTHQDGRLPSATIIRSDTVRAKKPLFRNMAKKRTELCPSRLEATAEMVGED
ncbi:hypothetical protein ACOMHN_026160 [Nucella lapillus]